MHTTSIHPKVREFQLCTEYHSPYELPLPWFVDTLRNLQCKDKLIITFSSLSHQCWIFKRLKPMTTEKRRSGELVQCLQ